MAFNLKQADLIKYAVGGAATIGIIALLIGVNNPELSEPAPVKRASSVKPYTGTGGASGFDVSQAYQAEDDEEDPLDDLDYDRRYAWDPYVNFGMQGEADDDDDYYSYPADIVVGDHTGHPGPGSPPPGGHPGPVGAPWIHPGTMGHPGGPAGFRLNNRPFPLKRYHFTNDMWRIFGNRWPGWGGIFPGTPQLGYPYHPRGYPFFTSPFQCQRFPWSMMPQCRRFRPTPWRWPWQNRGNPWWNRRPGFPGGHPGMPGPHPGPGGPPHPGPGPH